MKNPILAKALKSKTPRRKAPYYHKKGQFVLTANFRSRDIDESRINLVGALSLAFPQWRIADILRDALGH